MYVNPLKYREMWMVAGTTVLVFVLIFGWFAYHSFMYEHTETSEIEKSPEESIVSEEGVIRAPVSMERVKSEGCVADGLLTEYHPDTDESVELINRSHCYYLHRAIETWRLPPDFEKIQKVMAKITKKDIVYGMFIAEAIDVKAKYRFEEENRNFDFSEMCRKGTKNDWGEHTCKPVFSDREYRAYIRQITRKAMDIGVQSFIFGQIYMQEGVNQIYAKRIVDEMRSYAREKKLDIIIGAQTGNIRDEKYLRLFDYIEGGVGIDSDGSIEDGPCLSKRGSCWALLWHDAYAKKANAVLLHLDWTGIMSDDLDIFARMSREDREKTLKRLHAFFVSKDMGFLMPYFGVLHKENGGCYGPKKRFYSPDNRYFCKDEDVISEILSGGAKIGVAF